MHKQLGKEYWSIGWDFMICERSISKEKDKDEEVEESSDGMNTIVTVEPVFIRPI